MHLTRNEFDEAQRLIAEVPVLPAFSAFYNVFGGIEGRRGHWNAALTNFMHVVEFMPSDHQACLALAPLQLQTANVEAYARHRERMLREFAATKDPVVAERMTKACLLTAPSPTDMVTLAKMSETAIAAGPDHKFWPYFAFVKGFAEFRQGHFTSARDWIGKALEQQGDRYRTTQAFLVLAMTEHELNQESEARTAFAHATEIIETRMPNLQRGVLDEQWFDWLIVHLLYDEAKSRLDGPRKTGNGGKQP
jgi:hypothetical protein